MILLYFFIPINKITADINVVTHKPTGVNTRSVYPKNTGTAPINKANVNKPKAIPLLLNKILFNAVNVIGIVILKNNIASIPRTLLLNANINNTDETIKDIRDTFINPILSPNYSTNHLSKNNCKNRK